MNLRHVLTLSAAIPMICIGAGQAFAAGPFSGMYVSGFGGVAVGVGTVEAHGWENEYDYYDCETASPSITAFDLIDDNYCYDEYSDAVGTLGNGWLLGVALGTHLMDNVRGEIELSHASVETNVDLSEYGGPDWAPVYDYDYEYSQSGRFDATFLLANVWFDVQGPGGFAPYLGGGVGLARVNGDFPADFTEVEDPSSDLTLVVDGFAPAAQIGGGVRMEMGNGMLLDIGYRFKGIFNVPVHEGPNFSTEVENYYDDDEYADYSYTDKASFGVHVFQIGLTIPIQ